MDACGPRLGKVLEGRGSGGKDVKGTRVLIGKHVGPWGPGERVATVGGGTTWEPAGSGWGRRVLDEGVGGGASGRKDRRLEDKPVLCNSRECGYTLNGGGLNGRRRSRIGPRLLLLIGADGFRGAVDDGA